MSEAKKLGIIFRAAAHGVKADRRPPDGWDFTRPWQSRSFSEQETTHMNVMENVFSAIAEVFEKAGEAEESCIKIG